MKRLTAALTKAQVEKNPAIDTDKPVSRQHETAYYAYYGYTPYWAGSYLWGAYPYPALGVGPALGATELAREQRWNWAAKAQEDPHLRSARAVTGYHFHKTDGEIGHKVHVTITRAQIRPVPRTIPPGRWSAPTRRNCTTTMANPPTGTGASSATRASEESL
jgi:hypothetical protein